MTIPLGSFDFLALVSFVWKCQWEGGFDYTWENYPPTFRDPLLRPFENDVEGFRKLLLANSKALHQWEKEMGPAESSRLVNEHREEARRERDSRCLWAVRFANGNISCEEDEDLAMRLGANESWGLPAVLRRQTTDEPWEEVEPLGPKDYEYVAEDQDGQEA